MNSTKKTRLNCMSLKAIAYVVIGAFLFNTVLVDLGWALEDSSLRAVRAVETAMRVDEGEDVKNATGITLVHYALPVPGEAVGTVNAYLRGEDTSANVAIAVPPGGIPLGLVETSLGVIMPRTSPVDGEVKIIRTDDVGFGTELASYLESIGVNPVERRIKRWPGEFQKKEVEPLAFSFPWPIDMTNPDAHIAGWFKRHSYYNLPDYGAIDIQVDAGTQVFSIADGVITTVYDDFDDENLIAIHILSEDTNLSWSYTHLDRNSLPEKILTNINTSRDRRFLRSDRLLKPVHIGQGEYIGRVGQLYGPDWEGLPRSAKVPKDVEARYGRTFNNLNLRVSYRTKTYDEGDLYFDRYDPLLLLKPLYQLSLTDEVQQSRLENMQAKQVDHTSVRAERLQKLHPETKTSIWFKDSNQRELIEKVQLSGGLQSFLKQEPILDILLVQINHSQQFGPQFASKRDDYVMAALSVIQQFFDTWNRGKTMSLQQANENLDMLLELISNQDEVLDTTIHLLRAKLSLMSGSIDLSGSEIDRAREKSKYHPEDLGALMQGTDQGNRVKMTLIGNNARFLEMLDMDLELIDLELTPRDAKQSRKIVDNVRKSWQRIADDFQGLAERHRPYSPEEYERYNQMVLFLQTRLQNLSLLAYADARGSDPQSDRTSPQEEALHNDEMEEILVRKARENTEIARFKDTLEIIAQGKSLGKVLAELRGQLILEIGPGRNIGLLNFLIRDLKFDSAKIYAIDPDFEYDQANPQFSENRYACARIESPPVAWQNLKFDKIFAFYTFGLMDISEFEAPEVGATYYIDYGKATESIDALLKPGGMLIATAIGGFAFNMICSRFGNPTVEKDDWTVFVKPGQEPLQRSKGPIGDSGGYVNKLIHDADKALAQGKHEEALALAEEALGLFELLDKMQGDEDGLRVFLSETDDKGSGVSDFSDSERRRAELIRDAAQAALNEEPLTKRIERAMEKYRVESFLMDIMVDDAFGHVPELYQQICEVRSEIQNCAVSLTEKAGINPRIAMPLIPHDQLTYLGRVKRIINRIEELKRQYPKGDDRLSFYLEEVLYGEKGFFANALEALQCLETGLAFGLGGDSEQDWPGSVGAEDSSTDDSGSDPQSYRTSPAATDRKLPTPGPVRKDLGETVNDRRDILWAA